MQSQYLLPRCDLGIIPNPRSMRLTTGLGRDVRGFCDEQRARHAGALLVALDAEVGVDVCCVGAIAGLRGKDNAVGEGDVAHLDGLEESRGGRHVR